MARGWNHEIAILNVKTGRVKTDPATASPKSVTKGRCLPPTELRTPPRPPV
ncbi:hypothetical protein PSMK_09910 [Phycisphaera mikurensis NBRC 102666]|uniref:Uncharacterized protein n=1 Tax=Phycisphaera mikurensis (strain NBRC 102666 / KCTC 22515 / FYK2301M01) TaxID=1142394 RepID=I0ID12_PHYMF|nr:hypothetical protein PSMK_09910 [Phycisphaera mikurensis NBRC 102666]